MTTSSLTVNQNIVDITTLDGKINFLAKLEIDKTAFANRKDKVEAVRQISDDFYLMLLNLIQLYEEN